MVRKTKSKGAKERAELSLAPIAITSLLTGEAGEAGRDALAARRARSAGGAVGRRLTGERALARGRVALVQTAHHVVLARPALGIGVHAGGSGRLRSGRGLAVAGLLLPITRLLLAVTGLLLPIARLLLSVTGLLLPIAVVGIGIPRLSVTGLLPAGLGGLGGRIFLRAGDESAQGERCGQKGERSTTHRFGFSCERSRHISASRARMPNTTSKRRGLGAPIPTVPAGWHSRYEVRKLAPVMARARRNPPPRARTWNVRNARMWAATVALFALVVAVVSAGQRYFYCPVMERSAFSACCEHDSAETANEANDHVAITELADCCEARSLEANGPYAPHHAPPPIFAAFVAILPALFGLPEVALFSRPPVSLAEVRAGPSPREARATLQIYLC